MPVPVHANVVHLNLFLEADALRVTGGGGGLVGDASMVYLDNYMSKMSCPIFIVY